jgi:3'-phosphoadenosine 5'-phosphosulfate sulfotransferase (PAPS reductase)/FAD synthetase
MKQYLMCSGGKDSMASAILCYKKGIHLDGIVTAEIMFSHEKNISAEHPEHIKWFYEIAKPTLEKWGYKVIVLKSEKDYVQHFHDRISRSNEVERIGKKKGFVLGGNMCALKRDCKIKVLNDWCKAQGEFTKILGIAYDEQNRLEYMHTHQKHAWSILEQEKINEDMAFTICREYNLLSPFYASGRSRQGCWFCPNASIDEMAQFAKEYPAYWNELRILAQDEETVSKYFKYDRTFASVDREIELINNQLSLFDM